MSESTKKKVFSGYRYLEDALNSGSSDERIWRAMQGWVTECEGLTETEMAERGYHTSPDWMGEISDERN